jgi:hypothetical protein
LLFERNFVLENADMKKAFPVLWRYILVVITSCALAFFISQNTAKAAEFAEVNILNPSIGAAFEPFLTQVPQLKRLYEPACIGAAQKLKGGI